MKNTVLGSVPKLHITQDRPPPQDRPPSSRGLTTGSTTEYMGHPVVKPRDDGGVSINRQEKNGHITRISAVFRVRGQSLVSSLLLCSGFHSFAVNVEPDPHAILITGDMMEYNLTKNQSEVTGHAHAEKGPRDQKQTLAADHFLVRFVDSADKYKENSKNDVRYITAEGHVTFIMKDLNASAGKCVYVPANINNSKIPEHIDCEKNVVILKDGNKIMGDEATINLESGTYVIKKTPQGKRVQAEIEQPVKKKN
ncbi:MAG: hypothetical protein NTX76_00080 [Alphaproteobacteria bacterium]|nr:hypothetical protein [Alphaproteobacteria bacterium]